MFINMETTEVHAELCNYNEMLEKPRHALAIIKAQYATQGFKNIRVCIYLYYTNGC